MGFLLLVWWFGWARWLQCCLSNRLAVQWTISERMETETLRSMLHLNGKLFLRFSIAFSDLKAVWNVSALISFQPANHLARHTGRSQQHSLRWSLASEDGNFQFQAWKKRSDAFQASADEMNRSTGTWQQLISDEMPHATKWKVQWSVLDPQN